MLADRAKFLRTIAVTLIAVGGVVSVFVSPFLPSPQVGAGVLVALALLISGLLVLSLGHWARIRTVIFTSDGFLLSAPTALMCLSLIVGFDPGAADNAFLMVWLVFFILALPWSIAAFLLGWIALAGHNSPIGWSLPLFVLSCLGSHGWRTYKCQSHRVDCQAEES